MKAPASQVYAVGSSPLAAFRSGISVGRTKILAYALTGFFAAAGGKLKALVREFAATADVNGDRSRDRSGPEWLRRGNAPDNGVY